MKRNVFSLIFGYIKEHTIVFSYFTFLVLAILPTAFSFFNSLGIAYKIGVLLLFTGFIVYYLIRHKIKLNFRLLAIPIVLFICFALYYLTVLPKYFSFISPNYSYIGGTSITLYTDFRMRINSIISVFNICYFATLFLIVSPRLGLTKKDLVLFCILINLLVLVACIYSIKEFKDKEMYDVAGLVSFLGNKNTFGQYVMVAVFASFFCIQFVKKWYWKILFGLLAIVFIGFCVFSKSSTATILTMVILIVALIFYVMDFKIKIRYKILIYIGLALIVGFFASSPWIPKVCETKMAIMIKDLYDKTFAFSDQKSIDVFTGRGKYWQFGGYIITPKYLMLGFGSQTLKEIIYRSTINYFTTAELTNQYLTIINAYGVVGSLFFLSVFIYLGYKYYRSKSDISEWLFLLLIIYLVYGVFESLYIFESFSGSLLLTPILVAPVGYMMITKKEKKMKKEKFCVEQ